MGALGGGIKALRFDVKKIFENNELLDEIIAMMQRAVLMKSESRPYLLLSKEKILNKLLSHI